MAIKKTILTITGLFFCSLLTIAQEVKNDSLLLEEVTVEAFRTHQTANKGTAAVHILTRQAADTYNKLSLLSGVNTISGVRMEERSPGSYRLNIRGSSLRSPFGVRNVKVYWNNIPLTDPGGNTYFNQLAFNNFSTIELVKGPPSSMYGAGTGGLVLFNSLQQWKPGTEVEYITGSYQLQNILATVRLGNSHAKHVLTYAHNQSKGYRQQSELRRDNFSWTSQYTVNEKYNITTGILYNNMYYQTPGALTRAEYDMNPKAARPAAGSFPGAVTAKAAIFQKNLTLGITNNYSFNRFFSGTTTIYGSYTDLKNAAIRNYEHRQEPHAGFRSTLDLKIKHLYTESIFSAGIEWQKGYNNIQVSQNKNGRPDTLQTDDDVQQTAYTIFIQAHTNLQHKWMITAGLGLNKNISDFTRLNQYPVHTVKLTYPATLMPRIALWRELGASGSVLLNISKGFSAPTTAELLPSTSILNATLQAEKGWNYELTTRYAWLQKKLQLSITGFYFNMQNALVQKRDLTGADYFVNAGAIKQKGIETQASYTHINNRQAFIKKIQAGMAHTWHYFTYGNYTSNNVNYKNKKVPSVPAHSIAANLAVQSQTGIYLHTSWYYAGNIFLNDANTATAYAYHLIGVRLGYTLPVRMHRLNLYAGVDNLLNENYSLGNDINAAANRYFNAAPRRNFYMGIAWNWDKKTP
jgi:iron complex outermembrane receptor protein